MLEDIIENYYEEEFLKADGFDEAVIGVEQHDMRLIYSVKKCIEILKSSDLNDTPSSISKDQ